MATDEMPNMNPDELTNDAKVILMLCGHFREPESSGAEKPLSLGEYNRLAAWMHDHDLRPEALLTDNGLRMLQEAPPDIDSSRIGRLLARGPTMAFTVEKWTRTGIWILCRSDARYPERLKRHLKKQAPPILYGIGDMGLLDRGGLAIVGSRNVDGAGENFTRQAARGCAGQGIQVVSGGARGVDEIAMRSALEAGGKVVGALTDSLSKAAMTGKYRDSIRNKRLVLLSAYSPEARFNVGNAMGRNKQIYALADYALIISAEKGKGGTWAGATEELKRDYPRPVFVRDGENAPAGNRELLTLGARPFPSPPWGDGLGRRLAGAPEIRRPPGGVQRTLFGEPEPLPRAAAAIEEASAAYGACETIPVQRPFPLPTEAASPQAGIFTAVLPVLLNALEQWQTSQELAKALDVRKSQLDDWLQRAVAEGLVQKKGRPVSYRRK
jgi:predicted Rossmann fold nucleotide-binding protein DprA/Smf involved in DNA uptake